MAPALVQKLLNEVGDDADQLPVLQHALMRIWEVWKAEHNEDEPLGLRHYERTGGMAQALSIHGDEVYDGLPIEEHRRVAERVFKALTERGSDNRAIRRPTTLGDLVKIAAGKLEHVETVVNAYRATGRTFLMPPEEVPLAEETVVDISHESLMRVWHRLGQWVDEETQSARIFIRLAETAELHEQEKAGYYRDTDLQVALAWQGETERNVDWADRYHPGFDRAIAFLEASNEAQLTEQQQHEAERERQLLEERARAKSQERTLRKMIWLSGGLGLTAVAAVIAFVLAYQASQSSNMYQQFAQRAGNLPLTKGQRVFKRNGARMYETAIQIAQESEELARFRGYQSRVVKLMSQVDGDRDLDSLGQQLGFSISHSEQSDPRHWEWYFLDSIRPRFTATVLASTTTPLPVCWHPLERLASVVVSSAVIGMWDPELGAETIRFGGLSGPIDAMAWNSDGSHLAAGVGGHEVKIWNASSGLELAALSGHAAPIRAVAWLPGDKQLVSCDAAGVVHVWQWQSGESTHSLQTGLKPARAAFRPDGIWLAAASDTGALRVWQLSPEAATTKIATEGAPIRDLAWNRAGERLAIVRRDGPVEVWQPAADVTSPSTRIVHPQVAAVDWHPDGQHLLLLDAGGRVSQFAPGTAANATLVATVPAGGTNLTVSADGTCLAVNGADGVIRFRSTEADLSNVSRFPAGDAAVVTLESGKTGGLLATGGVDGSIGVVDASSGSIRHALQVHQGPVNAIALDEAAGHLVSAGADGSVQLWDLQQTDQPTTLARDLGPDATAIFSPDGKQVVWGGSGGQVVLWDLESAQQRAEFDLGEGSVRALAWSPTNSFLAIGWRAKASSGDEIVVYDPTTLEKKGSVRVSQEHLVGLRWTPVGERLVSASNPLTGSTVGVLRLWSMEQADPLTVMYDVTGPLRSFACSPDGERIASVGRDGRLRLWSTAHGQEVVALHYDQAESGQVVWLPQGRRIVMADQVGRVAVWDASDSYQRFASERELTKVIQDTEESTVGDMLAQGLAWTRLGRWDNAGQQLGAVLSEQGASHLSHIWTANWIRTRQLETVQPGRKLLSIATPFKINTEGVQFGNMQNPRNGKNFDPIKVVKEDILYGIQVDALENKPDDFSMPDFYQGWIMRNFQESLEEAQKHLWKQIRASSSGEFDFKPYLSTSAISASCDLYSRVYARQDASIGLRISGSGGFAGWLNGEPLLADGGETDADSNSIRKSGLFVVSLQAGWNELYVRAFDQPNGGGLRIRMTRSPAELSGELERAERWQEAAAQWQKIVSGSNARPADWLRYSCAAERAGLVTEALAAVRELQAAYPENKALQDRVTRLSEHAAKTGGGSE